MSASIASPTSPPYVGKQITALFHTQSMALLTWLIPVSSTSYWFHLLLFVFSYFICFSNLFSMGF